MENVVTSLDFERLLCATGPYEGQILRPSDKKHPHKIAWIHCVGSRQVIPGGNSYCSAVCCSYTQKQVILAKDHDADIEATDLPQRHPLLRQGLRALLSASGKPARRSIHPQLRLDRQGDPGTKNVTIRYATTDDGVKEEEFELVVLSVGLNPPKDAAEARQHVRHRTQ